MVRKSFFLSLIAASAFSANAFAGVFDSCNPCCCKSFWSNFYVGVEGGASISTRQELDQHIPEVLPSNLTYFINDADTFRDSFGTSGFWGAFAGYKLNCVAALELTYDHRDHFTYDKTFEQSPVFLSIDPPEFGEVYRFHAKVDTLLAGVKLTAPTSWCGFRPYVQAAVGEAWNRTGHLHNFDINTPEFQQFDSTFDGHHDSSFAWDAGVGVDYSYCSNIHFNLGYRFLDAGRLATGQHFHEAVADTQGNSVPLRVRHFQTNEVLVGISYHFS